MALTPGTRLGVYEVTAQINTELDDADAPITLIMNWNPEAKK